MDCISGNTAATHAAYGMSEVAFIFPITPSSTMAETTDNWSASGKKNCYGSVTKVYQLESEGGAAGIIAVYPVFLLVFNNFFTVKLFF